MIGDYSEQIGLPVEGKPFVAEAKRWLETVAQATDTSFPDNKSVRFEKGEFVLTRPGKLKKPKALKKLERFISEAIEPVSVLDVLVDTENWLNWSRFFRRAFRS